MIRRTMPVLRLAQRFTLAIFCADFLTMLAMNCLGLKPAATPWLFFPLLAMFLLTARELFAGEQSLVPAGQLRQLILIAVAFGGVCAAMRWAYLIEPVRHQVATAVGDDLWHIQEINSLVNSLAYPARSSFTPANYLSFYYAPWEPAVAIYFALPSRMVTLSTVLFAVNAIYDLLLPLTLLGIAIPMARTRTQISWAVYLVGLWSGVQSLYSIRHPFRDDSWPLRDLFGLNLQFSNLATLMIWVIHHLCAAVALLLAFALWRSVTGPRRVLLCAVLVAFSIYSSAFVCLGALPFLLLVAFGELRKRAAPVVLCLGLAGLLVAPMLWMFLRKPDGISFQMPLRHSQWMQLQQWLVLPAMSWHYTYWFGFVLFVGLLAAQFFFVPWLFAARWRAMSRNEQVLASISVAYLVSTFFVGFTGANNYCMRGSIVPVFVLSWIASAHLPRPNTAVGILLVAGSMGTWQTFEYQLLRSVALYFKPPPYLVESKALLETNQDRSRTSGDLMAVPGVRQYPGQLPYYVHKLPLDPWPLQVPPDRELQTLGPAGPWSWQRR